MPEIGEQRFDSSDGKEDTAKNIKVLCADEVVDCFCRVVRAEDTRIICGNVDYPGDEESCEPKSDNRCKNK